MAAISGVNAANGTLTANTVDTVVLSGTGNTVVVTNTTLTAPIFFTVSHPGGSNPQPTINGANCYCAASVAGGNSVTVKHVGLFGYVVNLISSGTPSYNVSIQD